MQHDADAKSDSDGPALSYAGSDLQPARSFPALVWLCLLQLPSAIGIVWFWSIVFGFMQAGIWGVVMGGAIMTTVLGCIISGIAALCFLISSSSPVRKTARVLAIFQAVYLVLFIGGIAITIATHPSHGHPGGGF
jgi:hypothetical protein